MALKVAGPVWMPPRLALNATVFFNERMLEINKRVVRSVADLLFYSAASSGTSLIKV